MKRNNEIFKVEKPEVDGNLVDYKENNKFLDLHAYYNEWERNIKNTNLDNLQDIRKEFVNERHSLDKIIKNNPLSEGMRKFLKGKRKIVTNLITRCNERITLINKVINNGRSMPLSMKFMEIASQKLDSSIFQKILIESMKDVKLNDYQMSIIKEYLKEDNFNK